MRGFSTLPGAGYPLVFGSNFLDLDFGNFSGQITALNIFRRERNPHDVQCTIRTKSADRTDLGNVVGRWDLNMTSRIPATYYYVTDVSEEEDLDPDSYYPGQANTLPLVADPAEVPLKAIVDNNLLYVFRQTTGQKIIADIFQLNGTTLTPVGTSGQILSGVPDCYRGWFAGMSRSC